MSSNIRGERTDAEWRASDRARRTDPTAKRIPTTFEVELTSGAYFDVTAPDHHALTLNDIAEPLAKTCRYGGACKGYLSVAEHAVLVALKLRRLGAPVSLQLAGLHHDDPEFCLSDIQRPVKLALRAMIIEHGYGANEPYALITKKLEHAIWRAFGQVNGEMLWTPGDEHNPLVKDVDNWACAFEARHIMPSRGEHWEQAWLLKSATRPIPEHEQDAIHGWEWRQARDVWLGLHHELVTKALGGSQTVAA